MKTFEYIFRRISIDGSERHRPLQRLGLHLRLFGTVVRPSGHRRGRGSRPQFDPIRYRSVHYGSRGGLHGEEMHPPRHQVEGDESFMGDGSRGGRLEDHQVVATLEVV